MGISVRNLNVQGKTVVGVNPLPTPSNDVTPNPTPNWPDNYQFAANVDTSAQITGINTSITLSISWVGSGANFSVSVNNSNSYAGGTITTLSTSPTTFTVNNNQYVIFRLLSNPFGVFTRTGTVTNVSDSNSVLDSFTITLDNSP